MMRFALGMTTLAIIGLLGFGVNAAPATPGFAPSKVTISVKDAKLADVLKTLAEKSGNALLAVPDKWTEKPVTLDVKDATYFEALDRICEAAGLSYEPGIAGLALGAALKPVDVGVYLGPATVKEDRIEAALPPQSSTLFVCTR